VIGVSALLQPLLHAVYTAAGIELAPEQHDKTDDEQRRRFFGVDHCCSPSPSFGMKKAPKTLVPGA
jgi:hypothetical protein